MMKNFVDISPLALQNNPFHLIGSDWMLITAEKDGKVNTMTASWGGFGVMWGKNVALIALRPQRYTKEFIDGAKTFSLTVFTESYRSTLEYLGNVSGRTEDKISKSGLTVHYQNGTPYFDEAKLVMICKKFYAQQVQPEYFCESGLDDVLYPNKDYHTIYIAEIERIFVQENRA